MLILYKPFNSGIFVVFAVNVSDSLSDHENFTSAENVEDEANYGSNELKNETDEVKIPHIDEKQLFNSKEQLNEQFGDSKAYPLFPGIDIWQHPATFI